MNSEVVFQQADTQQLIEEIDRYLAAVDLFRSESCEPTWRPEIHAEIAVLNPTAHTAVAAPRQPRALITKSLHMARDRDLGCLERFLSRLGNRIPRVHC